jgi:hypothetical protein
VKAPEAAGKALLGLIMGTPRRQPNLRRLARRGSFQKLHSVSSQWLERHFQLIEADAPWLDRVGTELWDYCRGAARPPGLNPGFRVSAVCTRALTAVYGFDGPLLEKLDMLGEALFSAGWGKIKNVRRDGRPVEQFWVALTGDDILGPRNSDFGPRSIQPQWRPNKMLSRPVGMEGTPPWGTLPLSPDMSVEFVSPDDTRQRPPDHVGNTIRDAPRNYLLLDSSGADQRAPASDGHGSHDHAVAVSIDLDYYSNPNAKALQHRIPRYWLPTRGR